VVDLLYKEERVVQTHTLRGESAAEATAGLSASVAIAVNFILRLMLR
jgi:hypothetical protein